MSTLPYTSRTIKNLRWEIILDYLGGLNVITRVLTGGEPVCQSQKEKFEDALLPEKGALCHVMQLAGT